MHSDTYEKILRGQGHTYTRRLVCVCVCIFFLCILNLRSKSVPRAVIIYGG